MDIYGYQSYQYNQNELGKQMFAQQALASPLPYDRGIPEPHAMPAPSGAPWNVQGVTWGMTSPPQVVQFTAQSGMDPKPLRLASCTKRKSLDIEPVIPAKQLITEEKMAAHLSGLHISSDYTPHMLATEELMDLEAPATTICDKLKGHTLVLSEEVKRLTEEPLLPASLIERLEKPRMSVVLWKPKEEILKLNEIKEENSESKEEASTKRKGVLVVESSMDIEM